MADITFATPISELVVGVKAGNISAHDLVSASLEKIESAKEYHAILETNPEALAQAIAIDKRIEAGEILPLAGIPFIAKDNFLTFNTHTTASSNILAPFRAPYQSVAVERLEAAGAIMVAKANLDAFAHGSSTENSDFGPTKNPHDITRVPGGSSGGSIRLPASYCGVVGFKPTYGLIPRTGVIAMGSSTDVIGPITNSVSDAAIVLDVLAGKSESDSTSIDRIEGSYIVEKSQDLKGKSFGLIKEYLEEGINPEIKAQVLGLVDQIKARGAEVHEISLPATKLALAAYYILVPAEVSSNLARYDGVRFGHSSKVATDLEETYRLSREEGFGDEAKRRILIGTYVLSSGYYDAYYKRAQIVRTKLIQEFDAAFSKYDYLIGPTGPTVAFKLGANTEDILAMYLNDVMTVAVNLVGNAAISLPLGTQEKLPFGVQIISPQRTEKDLLGIAAEVETIIGDWRKR
jgi:aspartyl-tRNA(Asn)/glutamyl-tRNA(Gln) amidotransferase subunit A